jgi:hypothetical protein
MRSLLIVWRLVPSAGALWRMKPERSISAEHPDRDHDFAIDPLVWWFRSSHWLAFRQGNLT